jgi:histidinol-phosphate aminotransferase
MTRVEQWARTNIRELVPYSSAKDEFSGSDATFLDANENPFGSVNRYPDPQQRLLKAVLEQRESMTTDQIFIGNGSDEVIDLLLRVFCEPGRDKVATISPSYGMYEVSAAINNLEIEKIPLDENFDIIGSDFTTVLNDASIKVLFLCSPNNPTGNNLDRQAMINLVENFEGIVCVDEAYIEFSAQESLSSIIQQFDNLIITRTMSKARGLAGARVGYAFANRVIIQLLNKVKPPYNISSLNQTAAMNALEDSERFKSELKTILEERTMLQEELSKLDYVDRVYPTASNFILIRVNDADYVYNALLKKNIIIRNRSKQIENTVRISVGTPQENILLLKTLQNLT